MLANIPETIFSGTAYSHRGLPTHRLVCGSSGDLAWPRATRPGAPFHNGKNKYRTRSIGRAVGALSTPGPLPLALLRWNHVCNGCDVLGGFVGNEQGPG